MTLDFGIVLAGGLGNNLFQLNYHFYQRSLLCTSITPKFYSFDNFLALIYRRIRGVSSYEIHPLIFKLLPNAHFFELRLCNIIFLIFSRLCSRKIFGHLWIDPSYSGFIPNKCMIVRSYFMCDIPVSNLLVSRIKKLLEINDLPSPRICMHMRFNDSSFMALPCIYYEKAIGYALSWYPFLPVYIVSNDKSKALRFAETINANQSVDVVSGSIEDDFAFMAKSKILICSNSTFSWWASECSSEAQSIITPDYSTYGNFRFSPLSEKNRVVIS